MAWITILERDGYSVLAAANPLRSVEGDADAVRALLATINTPVVLVGHSYLDRPRCPSTSVLVGNEEALRSRRESDQTAAYKDTEAGASPWLACFVTGRLRQRSRRREFGPKAYPTPPNRLLLAQAQIVCAREAKFDHGSHAFFMGPMTSVGLHGEVDPLIYVDGKYASLPPMPHCFHASN
jgi:hypothetical protein